MQTHLVLISVTAEKFLIVKNMDIFVNITTLILIPIPVLDKKDNYVREFSSAVNSIIPL